VSRVLNALGIRLVGEHVAQLLAARFGSLDELAKASVDELAAIRGVGPTIAESIGQFFADAGNRRMLQRLAAAGVRVVEPKTAPSPGLAGKSFVLTGTLNEVTRSEAVDLVERSERGYRVRVAEDGLLVVGKQPGQKLETARRLGIPTMGEREFLAMLRSRAA
jgi:DNA ligase (NAD+)